MKLRSRKWALLIAILLLSLSGFLGGAWWWDARNYPMPGIPAAPPSPFSHPGWDWNESFVTNLSRFQDRLQSNRHSRLTKKWIRELELGGTYWTFRSGKTCAIHFAEDGSVFVRSPEGSLPSELEQFKFFERHGPTRVIFFPSKEAAGAAIEADLSAINENSIMLFAPGGGLQEVLDRSASSSYFDELGKEPHFRNSGES